MKIIPKSKSLRPVKLGNKGVSLIEMMIVVAIIMVTLFFFITGINYLFNLPCKQCSRELKAAIEKIRIDTMGRNAAGLRVYKNKNGVFIQELVSLQADKDEDKDRSEIVGNSEKRIGSRKVKVRILGEAGWRDLDETGVVLAFKRDTGGLYSSGDGHTIKYEGNTYSAEYISKFRVSSGSRTYLVSVGQLTGMVKIKDVSGTEEGKEEE